MTIWIDYCPMKCVEMQWKIENLYKLLKYSSISDMKNRETQYLTKCIMKSQTLQPLKTKVLGGN